MGVDRPCIASVSPKSKMVIMSKARDWFEKGCRAIKWSRYRHADRYLSQALALDPDWHDALQRRALAREYLRMRHEAVSDYRHALRIKPRCAWCWQSLADVYARMDKNDEALACLTQAIRLRPRESSFRHDRGQAYIKVGEYAAAILEFQRIRKMKGFKLLWRQGRGRALALQGMNTRALKDLDACVSMRPDSGESWLYRGLVKLKAHDREGASMDFRKAKKLGSHAPPLGTLKRSALNRLLRT